MTPDEFKRLAASIPKPTADAIHVHSRQETEALREFVDRRRPEDVPVCFQGANTFGIPIYIDGGTPPGVIRIMLDGDIVSEHRIR